MSQVSAFSPTGGCTSLAVTASSQTLTPDASGMMSQYRILVDGTVKVFIRFGAAGSSPVATVADPSIPLFPGVVEVFTLPPGVVIAAIAASTGSTIYVTPGEGM